MHNHMREIELKEEEEYLKQHEEALKRWEEQLKKRKKKHVTLFHCTQYRAHYVLQSQLVCVVS
jgi:hypothetical protein